MRHRLAAVALAGLACAGPATPPPPAAPPPAIAAPPPAIAPSAVAVTDVSGAYDNGDGTLTVLEGDGVDVLVEYSAVFGASAHSCSCADHVARDPGGAWAFGGITMRVSAGKLALEGDFPECCGANWPGDSFDVTTRDATTRCKVKAKKSKFVPPDQLMDDDPTAGKLPYVVRGDMVDTLPHDERYVMARFPQASAQHGVADQGEGSAPHTTLGYLAVADLDCQP
jgi:hypothetical protein